MTIVRGTLLIWWLTDDPSPDIWSSASCFWSVSGRCRSDGFRVWARTIVIERSSCPISFIFGILCSHRWLTLPTRFRRFEFTHFFFLSFLGVPVSNKVSRWCAWTYWAMLLNLLTMPKSEVNDRFWSDPVPKLSSSSWKSWWVTVSFGQHKLDQLRSIFIIFKSSRLTKELT